MLNITQFQMHMYFSCLYILVYVHVILVVPYPGWLLEVVSFSLFLLLLLNSSLLDVVVAAA